MVVQSVILSLKPFISKIHLFQVLLIIIYVFPHFPNLQNMMPLSGTFRDNICHVVEAPAEIPEKMKKLATNVAEKNYQIIRRCWCFCCRTIFSKCQSSLFEHLYMSYIIESSYVDVGSFSH